MIKPNGFERRIDLTERTGEAGRLEGSKDGGASGSRDAQDRQTCVEPHGKAVCRPQTQTTAAGEDEHIE